MGINFIISAVYFYLPGGLANIGANLGKFVPFLKKLDSPVDLGRTFRGQRIIGEHKVWSGFLFGIILGVFIGVIKHRLLDKIFPSLIVLNLSFTENLFLSFILASGAVTGDLIKSFIKRQINIPAHAPWIPFDEIDHTMTSMLLVKIFFDISWSFIVVTIISVAILHFVFNLIGYSLKVKKVPY